MFGIEGSMCLGLKDPGVWDWGLRCLGLEDPGVWDLGPGAAGSGAAQKSQIWGSVTPHRGVGTPLGFRDLFRDPVEGSVDGVDGLGYPGCFGFPHPILGCPDPT